MKHLAILHTGGLGDFLQVFPLLETARQQWPGLHVTIVGRDEWMPLAVAGGLAEQTVSATACGLHQLFVDGAAAEDVPPALADAETIISFLPHAALGRNLAAIAGARVIEVRSFPQPGECSIPAAQFVYDQVAPALGLPPMEAVPQLRLSTEGVRSPQPKWTGCVAIAPGSGSREKNWPLERFGVLSDRLAARGCGTLWLLGPAELEREEFALVPRERALVGESVLTVASALSSVRGCVGNDSGVTHLSAALGAVTTALFGPSDVTVWGPRGEHVRCVVAGDAKMASIGVEEVLSAVERACGLL